MDMRNRKVLNSNRELIIKDVHGDVIDSLLSKGVLNLEEYEKINLLNDQEERNRKLLDILDTKHYFLEEFTASLKEWYWWIAEKLEEEPYKEKQTWEEVISFVPSLPRRNVSRTVLLKQVRSALKQLKKSHYVVLHGMSGCGKSSLAAEALHHDILIEQFQGKVHWLSCGQDTKNDENEILALLIEFNERICDEELVSDVKTANVKTLRIKLMKRFASSDFKEGLIVLDDVNSAQVIDALNIGCKTLVTTNDIDVMKNHGSRYHGIKVNEGFTEKESLTHLAISVDLDVGNLPSYARQIHLHSKGHPMIMSLIGAQLDAHKEEARNNSDSWKPYLDVLVNKEYGELPRRSFGDEQFLPKTIELCINNLNPEMQKKYHDFALFVEDVNIKTEVLEVLWDLPRYKVRPIMEEFIAKSLIVCKFNPIQNCYVYGIHDILLYFLKKKLQKEVIKELHVKLIRRYKDVCKGKVAKLPKHDNYFFYYVGYHISNAEEYHLFPEWYFNLDFIEAKLKVAGAGDLLLDYKRYFSHFTEGNYDAVAVSRKMADFVRFVEAAGLEVRRTHNADIIQFALQEPHDSEVYKIAMRLAQCRPDSTYIRFPLGPSKSRTAPHTIQIKHKVTSACFCTDNNDIIVGFESGVIQIMNQKGYVTRVYEGHNESVIRLSIAVLKGIFLSVSDKCVKVWKLPDLDYSISSGTGDRTPSPSQRQSDFTDIFNHKTVDKQMSWLTIPHDDVVDWATFSSDGSKMASCCSDNGIVQVREMSNRNCVLNRVKLNGTSCIFSHNDELLVIGTSNSAIYIHNLVTNTRVNRLRLPYSILALFNLPENTMQMKFVALTKATLSVWELDETNLKIQPDEQNSIRCLRDYNKGEHEMYVCCAAAQDGSIVAVATSSGKILICDLSDGSVVREMNDSSGTIKYLAIDESKDHLLLACYVDDTIKIWTLGEVHLGKPATMKTNFVVTWSDNHTPIVVAPTYKSCVKKVFGSSKSEDLHIPVNNEINICGVSKCGKCIAISTTSGDVYLHFDTNKLQMHKIMTVKKCVIKLKVEILEKTVFVIVGLDRLCQVWKSNEDDMLNLSKSETFEIPLNDRLVEIFILLRLTEFMTVSQNGSIKKWSLSTGELVGIVCQARLDVLVCSSVFNYDNRIVTLDSLRQLINIYNLEDISHDIKIKLHSVPTCCSFSFNGNNLAVGFQDGSIQVFKLDMLPKTLKEITVLDDPVKSVCVNDQGLVCAATKSLVMLESATGGIGQAKLRVQRLVMSPDNSTVITVDTDGHMHLIEDFGSTVPYALGKLTRSVTNPLTVKLKSSSLAEKA